MSQRLVNLFDAELSGEEDSRIHVISPSIESYLHKEYRKPPGISNLRVWGECKMEDGKYKGRTHAEVFELDEVYSNIMACKQSLTSSWSLSFKNYVIARRKAMAREATRVSCQLPVMPGHASRRSPEDQWEEVSRASSQGGYRTEMIAEDRQQEGATNRYLSLPLGAEAEIYNLQTQVATLNQELSRLRREVEANRASSGPH
jgi:hypothetical protein